MEEEEGAGIGEVGRKGREDLAGVVVVVARGEGEGRGGELRFRGKGGSDVEEGRRRSRWVAAGFLAEEREDVGTECAGEDGVGRETGVVGGLEEEVGSEDPEERRSTRRSPARVRERERDPR